MNKIILLVLLMSFPVFLKSQTGAFVGAVIVGADTFPSYQLQEVVVVSKRTFKDIYDQARFNQLKKNVMVVYPYARQAGAILNEMNEHLATLDRKKDRKKYIKQKENELDDLFESELKNLTVTQGEILCKLVARETGLSVYDLIKELKNPLSAFYWNKMSQFLGYSLRYEYDPQQERDIELIVRSLEGDY